MDRWVLVLHNPGFPIYWYNGCQELVVCNPYWDGTMEWWWWCKSGLGLQNLEAALNWDKCLSQTPLCRLIRPFFPFWHAEIDPFATNIIPIKIRKVLIENYVISHIIVDTDLIYEATQWPGRQGNCEWLLGEWYVSQFPGTYQQCITMTVWKGPNQVCRISP